MRTSRIFAQWRSSARAGGSLGATESMWLEGLMPEVLTKPSVGSQTRVTKIPAREPDGQPRREEGPLLDGVLAEIQHYVPDDQSEEAPRNHVQRSQKSEACIENLATGKRTDLELHNRTYSLDVWRPSMSQVLRGWTGGEEFDKVVQNLSLHVHMEQSYA